MMTRPLRPVVAVIALFNLAISLYLLQKWAVVTWSYDRLFNIDGVLYLLGNERLYAPSRWHLLVFGLGVNLVPIMSIVTTVGSAVVLVLPAKVGFRSIRNLTIFVSILVVWQALVLLMFYSS